MCFRAPGGRGVSVIWALLGRIPLQGNGAEWEAPIEVAGALYESPSFPHRCDVLSVCIVLWDNIRAASILFRWDILEWSGFSLQGVRGGGRAPTPLLTAQTNPCLRVERIGLWV